MRKYSEVVPCRYTTGKDLMDRLSDTVIRYKGEPYYVNISGVKLQLYRVGQGTFKDVAHTILPDDPDLDISMLENMYMTLPPKCNSLGEEAYPRKVVYIRRDTSKNWKQGFCFGYSQTTRIDGQLGDVSGSNLVHSSGFLDAILDRYPSYHGAIAELRSITGSKTDEVAISQDVALRREAVGVIFLFYRTQMVGWIAPDSDKVNVVDNALGWVVEQYVKRLS